MIRLRSAVLLAFSLALVTSCASSRPKPMHIAFVGDSLAQGAGDETGKGIAGRLETELRLRDVADSIVASKFGATGATTEDIEKLLALPATRSTIAQADAVVVSVGANDLRESLSEGNFLRSPLTMFSDVLRAIDDVVRDIRRMNPDAPILVLGAYAPIALQRAAALFEPLAAIWDSALGSRFADDPRVFIVRMSDIVDRPGRLSTLDSFHPGGEAYQETAKRIAEVLADKVKPNG